jgi:glycine oxidase
MDADVVVIGGGVIGLAVAWTAASSGAAQVTVVDPAPGSGASHVAAGMLAPVTEARWGEEFLLSLNLASARAWPAFAASVEEASGLSVGFQQCGTLAVALDQGDRAELEELHRFQVELGLDSRWLSAREARELEPLLAPSIRGALLAAGDHQVDNRKLVAALLMACEQSGVSFVREAATSLDVAAGRSVVLAAGCRCASLALASLVPVPVSVRPVKGQILRLTGPTDPPLIGRSVRAIVNGHSLYLVPRASGEIVVGATVEEQGFDRRVTAGAVYELLRDAQRVLPALAELELAETAAGLRPGTPDNLPIVGESGVPGLILATGHGRNGFLLTPITAQIVAGVIGLGPAVPEGVVCAPSRFDALAARQ